MTVKVGKKRIITSKSASFRNFESNEFLGDLANTLSDVIIATDLNFEITYWNKAAEHYYGWREAEVIGKSVPLNFPPTYIGTTREDVLKSLNQKGYWKGEVIPFTKDGSKIVMLSSIFVVKNNKGKKIGYVSVNKDITEIKKIEQRRDELMHVVSHEIKNPITSARLFSEFLRKQFEKKGDTQSALYLSKMSNQINRISTISEDLLSTARILRGDLDLKYVKFDLVSTVRETVDNLNFLSGSHSVYVRGLTKCSVFADKNRIIQVLSNLISNAVKYSPKGGKVIISIKKSNAYVQVEIKDFGIGIPSREKRKLFGKFHRVPNEHTAVIPGLGLGLYISKGIIEKHGGRLSFKSALGKGSVFLFYLPLGRSN